MICGRTLFVGPIIALSLLPGIARSADDSASGLASTTEEKVDQPTRRSAVEISDDATATWRRSHNQTAANIRFIKPSIPGRAHAAAPARAAAPSRALATDGGPSSESMQGYRQRDFALTHPAQAPAIVSDAGIGKARPPVIDRQLAGATAAKLQQLIELPKLQLPAAIQTPNQPADGDRAIAACATNAPTQFQEQNSVFIKDEPDNVADKRVVQTAASAPRQLWATGTRLLQGIGKLFPVTGSRSTVAQ